MVAAPDFRDNEHGIPDGNSGRTFVMESTSLVTITVTPGTTTFIVIPPTPLVSHYRAEGIPNVSSGDSILAASPSLQGYFFPENVGLFPHYYDLPDIPTVWRNIVNTTAVDQFRVITHSAELVNTNNAFNTYGTITAYKTDMNMVVPPVFAIPPSGPAVLGPNLEVTGATPLMQDVATTGTYVQPSRAGVYTVAMCHTGAAGDFPFRTIFNEVNANGGGIYGPAITMSGASTPIKFYPAPPGWDQSYDTHVYRISVPEGGSVVAQQFILKVWRRIEYTPVMFSLLWHISSQGEPRSDSFFKMYGAMERKLPIAVTAKENPDFWDTMLKTVKNVSSVARAIPGPVGLVADVAFKGAKAISRARKGKSTKTAVRKVAKKANKRK